MNFNLYKTIVSPDRNEKPFEIELYFFSTKKSDWSKLLFSLRKKQCYNKA